MEDSRESIEESLFQQAVELTTPASRGAFLEEACRGDVALRQTLELLLEGHFHGEGFLTRLPARPADVPPPRVDDKYQLREKIGEGGFGEVWHAEQLAPVRRSVAIKILKAGMDTRQVVARFDAERQALAMMDHPNIAQVFDAGATDLGRPFFVMESVRGSRITDYCDQNNLSTKERLHLFITVCHAIQHAHQKGVIHRDIKPSNILVTTRDGVPVPKVIDFGIAKATEGSLVDATFQTQWHQFLGTPAYMSPEQAELRALDVDTRSDIYSLGVLLYELLIGTTPFDGKELMAAGVEVMCRTIRETEPARPSTRLGTLGADRLATTASRRSTDAAKLVHQLKGDLDWIVLKCMEKDRSRRYETANGLAADLKRHLQHEPVAARPPSTAYRLQKFFRRNRLGVTSGVAVVLVLVIAAVASGGAFVREKRARLAEQNQRESAQAAQADAAAQRDVAQELLFDSLLREMRAMTTIRRFGYRSELMTRVRQALELPQASRRLASIRAEFMRGLGDPIGLEPRVVPWQDHVEGSGIVATALSPDGRIAAMGTFTNGLAICDTATGTRLAQLELGHPPWLRFSLDGRSLFGFRRLAGAKPDLPDPFLFEVLTWGTDGSGVWTARPSPWPRAAALMATAVGVLAMAPAEEGAAVIRNLETGEVLARLPPELVRVSSVKDYAPQLGLWAVGNSFTTSTAIDVSSMTDMRRRVRLEPAPGMGRFTAAHFSSDERLILCTAEEGAMVFETTNFREVNRLFGNLNLYGGVFVQDGAAVAIPEGQRAALRMIPLSSGLQTEIHTRGIVRFLTANHDGSMLMFADETGMNFVRLTDAGERRRLIGHSGGVTAVEFSSDGRLLASTGKDGVVRWWETNSGKLQRVSQRAGAIGQSLSFSPDGRWLAVGDFLQEQIQVLSVETGEMLFALGEAKPGRTWACTFSPDGRRLFASGERLRVWEIEGDANARLSERAGPRLILEQTPARVGQNLQIAPSGRWLAYSGVSNNARHIFVRPLDSPKVTDAVLAETHGRAQTLAFVPAREELAFVVATSKQRELHFVGLGNAQVIRKIPLLLPGERATAPIDNLRFSPDGSRLAIANGDGRSVDIVEAGGGRRLYSLPDESGVIWWLAWHPDGRRLAVARENGDISVWNLTAVEAALSEARLTP